MKKINYLALAAAGLLMASCSQEDLQGPGANVDGNYVVTVKLPADLTTRATGVEMNTGYTAMNLNYAVWDTDGVLVETGEATFNETLPAGGTNDGNDLETTVGFNLASGKAYKISFFASAPNNKVYKWNPESKVLTVDYMEMNSAGNSQEDLYDCFINLLETGVVGTDVTPASITLYRPIAQINWGTNDYAVKSIEQYYGDDLQYLQSALTTNVYTTFNLFENEVDESQVVNDVTLAYFTVPVGPNGQIGFPVGGYEYVGMQYLLAPKSESLFDLNLTINNGVSGNPFTGTINNAVAVSSAPVQANYRTNIYGALLTDNVDIKVVKSPDWGGNYGVSYSAWDGKTTTTPAIDPEEKTATVSQPSDLAGLAAIVNGTAALPAGVESADFAGYTVILDSDLDMGGNSLSIGSAVRSGAGTSSAQPFAGTFDGNGKTIKNISYTAPADINKNTAVGVFPNLTGEGKVQNVTFENLNINAGAAEQAGVVGLLTDGATVSNVTVSSGSISAAEGAGAIVGRMTRTGTVENCNNNATITVTQQNGGGIVGAAYYTSTEGDMVISGCKNSGNVTSTSASSVAVGGIVGLSAATVENCENSGAVLGVQNSVGGIVGAQQSAGYVRNCINRGTVTAENPTMGVGGIVGWVKYLNDDNNYPKENIIEVTGCTNYANITGNNGVGGIVGSWYRAGVCSDNHNYADKLVAKSGFVAGIIGSSQFLDNNNGPAPDKVEGYVDMLYVENNETTTAWDNMEGTLKAWIVYVNNSAKVTLQNNTPDQNN